MANNPTNDVQTRSDLLGRVEALERQAGAAGRKRGDPAHFSGVSGAGGPQGYSWAVRLIYDQSVVVRAVAWYDAERVAWQMVNLKMVTVASATVLWSLGAGLYRVRVEGLHRYTLAKT